ncbi:MAG: PKD domain-containing protein [Saprospiraceae bacterium]|nr:PKD domain-containing protein [Candidatus Opimibacter skivensis]
MYQFSDRSSGPVGSRLWGFGDGQISAQTNPVHLYASTGVYTVCLLTIDDGDVLTLTAGHSMLEQQLQGQWKFN